MNFSTETLYQQNKPNQQCCDVFKTTSEAWNEQQCSTGSFGIDGSAAAVSLQHNTTKISSGRICVHQTWWKINESINLMMKTIKTITEVNINTHNDICLFTKRMLHIHVRQSGRKTGWSIFFVLQQWSINSESSVKSLSISKGNMVWMVSPTQPSSWKAK